jgi:hypothetical protein
MSRLDNKKILVTFLMHLGDLILVTPFGINLPHMKKLAVKHATNAAEKMLKKID